MDEQKAVDKHEFESLLTLRGGDDPTFLKEVTRKTKQWGDVPLLWVLCWSVLLAGVVVVTMAANSLPAGLDATERRRPAPNVDWIPKSAFEEWKRYHSVEALWEEMDDPTKMENRKFVLGLYSCPDQAGNYVHEFTVSLLIAVVTNRTLLWGWDENTLNKNVQSECDQVMRPKSWVPAHDEWKHVYNLPDPLFIKAKKLLKEQEAKTSDTTRFVSLADTQQIANSRLIHPSRIYHTSNDPDFWLNDVLLQQEYSFTLNSQMFGFENSTYANDIVTLLYAEGRAFLFVSSDTRVMP